MQSLPLEAKIRMTKRRIEQWYEEFDGDIYVSFSGGKDSTVLLSLVRTMYPEVPGVYCDTGLEYPEIRAFVKQENNIRIIKPDMNFKEVILKKGYPVISKEVARAVKYARKKDTKSAIWYLKKFNGTLMHHGKPSMYNMTKHKYLLDAPFEIDAVCCDIMKKRPFHKFEKEAGLMPIVGTMASESRLRKQKWIQHGCNLFDSKSPQSNPLSFWTEQDILQYLIQYDISFCSVYGQIIEEKGKLKTTMLSRTGCMFCMFGCHLERSPNRFEMMRETHPKQYAYCMKPVNQGGLGIGEVLDFIGVSY